MPDAPASQPAAPAAAASPPAKPAAAPAAQGTLSAAEEVQLGELLAKRDTAGSDPTVRLRVEGAHSQITVGHVTVGTDWTDVPAHMAAALLEGAADAGVKITQAETE